jgi:ribose 1,5-bisphosphokinase
MMGRLIYVMGPSGAGKDTLLGFARARLSGSRVVFAHRYITRPADAGGENHVYLSHEEFAQRADCGLFALHWTSHGLHYGVGIEIEAWMARGFSVVVNGSRGYLTRAAERYPGLEAVHISARTEVLAARLAARGRETLEEVGARLARKVPLALPAHLDVKVTDIDNSGAMEHAGYALVDALKAA